MSFVARAELRIAVPREAAFDRLADLSSWRAWMPRSFRLVGRAKGPLASGDRLRVRIAGAPVATTLEVSVARRPDEIAWRGGSRRVLWAEHRFLFEADGANGTLVRSVETWQGALALLLRRFVQPRAERVGADQLAGLAKALSS
jgi:polyketide cyclase/dehydrase/lipid transport protein